MLSSGNGLINLPANALNSDKSIILLTDRKVNVVTCVMLLKDFNGYLLPLDSFPLNPQF